MSDSPSAIKGTSAVAREWLLQLVPDDPGRELVPASTWTFGEASRLFPARVIRWGAETAHGMTEHILQEAPDFAGGEGPFETIRIGTEAYTWRAMLLVARADPNTVAVTPETTIGVHDFVRRGIPLEVVLRGIQLGHAYVVRRFLRACEQVVPAEARAVEMAAITNQLLDFFDGFSTHISSEYIAERRRWVASGGATREDLVRAILERKRMDLRAAEFTLGYALDRAHTAIVIESDQASTDDPSELQRLASKVLHGMGCAGALTIPVGGTTVWAWGSSPSTGEVSTVAMDALDVPGHVHVSRGLIATGIDGFIRSHEQAKHASRVPAATDDEGHRWLCDFSEVELACLLSADQDLARDFVDRHLGALTDDGASELRRTLLTYLDEERSVSATAKRLHVARNTVSYRVKKAEALRRRPVGDHQLELHAALRIADRLRP